MKRRHVIALTLGLATGCLIALMVPRGRAPREYVIQFNELGHPTNVINRSGFVITNLTFQTLLR